MALPMRGGMPPKKIRCSFKECKDAAQRIVGDCGFCSGHYCGKHRLLEDHKCEGLEDCKKQSHERNADKLNSERTFAIRFGARRLHALSHHSIINHQSIK
jgi:predicted nucleic acid binding AN1-type Zn finger protein